MSKTLEDNFRAVSAIIIHELMHIFLNANGISYKTIIEYEESTDLACILLGFGIPIINAKRAWSVERKSLGSADMEGNASYYNIGYLTESQIGYAFAIFLVERKMGFSDVKNSIDEHCWYIVQDGITLEQISSPKLKVRLDAEKLSQQKREKKEICTFSCPVCFEKLAVPKNTIEKIGIFKVECPNCKSFIHFDGQHVIKFTEYIGKNK